MNLPDPNNAIPRDPAKDAAARYRIRMIHIVREAYGAAQQLLATPGKTYVSSAARAKRAKKKTEAASPRENKPDVWETLADFCISHGVNPWIYFRAQIRFRELLAPQCLMTPTALERYYEFYEAEIKACEVHLECERSAFDRGLDDIRRLYPNAPLPQLWTYTLLNDTLFMTPLFRYCIGYSQNLTPVIERYYESAISQFLSLKEGYLRYWSRLLPVSFVQAALTQQGLAGATHVGCPIS